MSARRSSARWVSPAYRIVAVPAALAFGSVGGIAAEHAHLPWIVGALTGALAAALGVLALPSIPTRRATVVLIGLGGLAALRHASFAGPDRSWLLALWAAATTLTLVLVDRADAETVPALEGGASLAKRAPEVARVAALIAIVVVVAAVAFVPTVTTRLGRHVWPGLDPSGADRFQAPASLQSADQLGLTTRPRLSNAVVFTVDASHEDFWRGETFDVYNGTSWSNKLPAELDPDPFVSRVGTRVEIAPDPYDKGARVGRDFRQVFHVEAGFSNVVFAAPSARIVETDKPILRKRDGTLRIGPGEAISGFPGINSGFGKGTVYTVTSRSMPVTAATLRAANTPPPRSIADAYARSSPGASSSPNVTSSRVIALGRQITAGATTTFDKVHAIENWLGAHTKYSLNAPLSSPRTHDVVDDFLFHTRVGWCEQIASSLVVLARSAGIPARLVTGFAPGTRDALTGRFVVRERDAHAWAEVYFTGIGWQGFDPTAAVPLSGDAKPGGSWLTDARRNAVPLAIAGAILVLVVVMAPELVAATGRRRARRSSWSARTLHRLERAGRKAGRARSASETPREYARVLAQRLGDVRLAAVGDALDAAMYSADGVDEHDRSAADAVLASL